jgi:hypothetical protein
VIHQVFTEISTERYKLKNSLFLSENWFLGWLPMEAATLQKPQNYVDWFYMTVWFWLCVNLGKD